MQGRAKRILVTGARGNVGREVVRECVAHGFAVREAVRPNAASTRDVGSDSVPFAFEQRATWERTLAGCDCLFLLRPPALANMDATLNPFIDAAHASGIEHIVFLSVSGAEKASWVPHRKVELHLLAAGKPWTLLRPGFFAQNLEDAYRSDIIEDARLYVPAADGRVAFLDVADVGAVSARLFEQPSDFAGKAFTLTGPRALTFYEVAQMLSERLVREIRYQPASVPGYLWHLTTRRRLPLMQAAVQAFLHFGLRHGDAESVTEDVELLLGRPASGLEQYIERCAAAWLLGPGARAR
ncbi:MAG TPA: NmrA family NAD(P)-binding protein [Polyangiaceae bacterium]|nr:NmrA family NAD(P)-binding protein [Polyangiaceae bacterium]